MPVAQYLALFGGYPEAVRPDGEGSAAAGFVAPNPVPTPAGSEDGCRDAGCTDSEAAMLDAAIKWGPKLLKREIDELIGQEKEAL